MALSRWNSLPSVPTGLVAEYLWGSVARDSKYCDARTFFRDLETKDPSVGPASHRSKAGRIREALRRLHLLLL